MDHDTVVGGPTYTFVAATPGTYLYHSGTNPELQVEMGLVGALIVRPTGYRSRPAQAGDLEGSLPEAGTNYDRENLFLLTEMDPAIHGRSTRRSSRHRTVAVDTTDDPAQHVVHQRPQRAGHAAATNTCSGCRPSRTTRCRACIRANGC